jgi:hypothetical protein
MIKSRRIRWSGHVARIVEKRNECRILMVKPEGKKPRARRRVGGRIILKWIIKK